MKSTTPKIKPNNKRLLFGGNITLLAIIITFLFIVGLFIFQYTSYKKMEGKLEKNYESPISRHDETETLFRLLTEADMTFRMYTLDFEDASYQVYREKLDSVKLFIDSLSTIPLGGDQFQDHSSEFQLRTQYAQEFAVLKKNMDDLIVNNDEHAPTTNVSKVTKQQISTSDSVITKLAQEVNESTNKDTIVRKREGLIKRIFNTRNDTIIVHNQANNPATVEKLQIINENFNNTIIENDRNHQGNIKAIRSTFYQLQEKEREMIFLNFEFLDQLKLGIEKLRMLEMNISREQEFQDFTSYKSESSMLRTQLFLGLGMMMVLIFLAIYYKRVTKQKEKELVEEVKYSNMLVREKTNIVAGISHEIRTPLNALLNITEMLKNKEEKNNDVERNQLTESAYYNIQTIINTVNDILTISKLEEGSDIKEFSEMEYFNPKETIQKIVSLHLNQSKLKNIDLRLNKMTDSNIQVLHYKFKISQVLSNLIGNAIKYTRVNGKILINCSIQKEKNQQVLIFEVIDNGIGIDEIHQEQIFRKYYTANPTTGFGLGLYITKTIAEDIKAKVSVKSKLGEGATFRFEVPIKEMRFGVIQDDKENEEANIQALNNLKVLIVDDNPINLLYINQLLKERNAIVYQAMDIKQAIEILEHEVVEIIITDIHLPDLSGWDLLKYVRNSESLKHIPVFSTTASIDIPISTYELVFDGSLPKPFNESNLLSLVGNHIRS